MRLRHRFLLLVIASALTVVPFNAYGAVAKSGSICSKVGSVATISKVKFACLPSKNSFTWQILNQENTHRLAVEKSVTLQALPTSLTNKLLRARQDKSFWLDQACSVDFESTDTPVCEGGDLSSSRLIILYGDSHASMWMSAVEKIAKKQGYKVRLFAKLACPIVREPIWSFQLNKPFTECSQWQQKVISEIQTLKPDVLITTDQWKPAVVDGKRSDYDTPFVWQKEYPKALQELSLSTKKLIVIGNNPSLTQDPVGCISKPRTSLALCSSGRGQADNAAINQIEKNATVALKSTYIDTVAWACTQSLCPVVIAGKIAYFDQWHFSESYVQYLLPLLEKGLKLPA
jgi:hypothetical protein